MPFASSGNTISASAQVGAGVITTTGILDGTIADVDVSASAAIAGSKIQVLSVGANAGVIASTGIVNADLAAGAAIADSKLATISTAGKVSGAALTLLGNTPAGAGVLPAANTGAPTAKVGVSFYAGDTASGAQTIVHGLGRVPKIVSISAIKGFGTGNVDFCQSIGGYDGSTNSCIFSTVILASNDTESRDASNAITIWDDNAQSKGQTAVITVDATNITITWTKTGLPSNNTIQMFWEVS